MWICSKLGFFSVVRKPDGFYHVRARVRKDLENLVEACWHHCRHRPAIYDTHETDPHADYAFRIVGRACMWTDLSNILMRSVDYANFKGVIGSTPDQRERLPIYSTFHHDMERFQNHGSGDPFGTPPADPDEADPDDPPEPWAGYEPERLGPRD